MVNFMSIESLRKSRKIAFIVFPICFFIWNFGRTDIVQTFLATKIIPNMTSNSHTTSSLMTALFDVIGVTVFCFGFYFTYRYIKKLRSADMSLQNVIKDELAKFEWSVAIYLTWVVLTFVLFVFSIAGGFGVSGKDISLILFSLIIGLPFLIFIIRDKPHE